MEYVAEILCVGNELLIGRTVNTNAAWLGRKLTLRGFKVRRLTVIGDDMDEISSAIREALTRRPTVLVITGGLGPTFDDMTSEALARALGREWVVNEEALKEVSEKYKEMGLELTEHRIKMARMPKGSSPLPNPVGTAPGILVREGGTLIVALPGVPDEMKGIFEAHVEPLLSEIGPKVVYSEFYLLAEGIPESAAAPCVEKVMKEVNGTYIKSHPRGREYVSKIIFHVQGFAKSTQEAEKMVKRAAEALRRRLEEIGAKVKVVSPDEVEW